jgi:hypothetical protein
MNLAGEVARVQSRADPACPRNDAFTGRSLNVFGIESDMLARRTRIHAGESDASHDRHAAAVRVAVAKGLRGNA